MNEDKLTPEQRKKWGKPVKGSNYVRDFCALCGEPIRVSTHNILFDNFCFNCDGRPKPFKKRTHLDHLVDYNGEIEQ